MHLTLDPLTTAHISIDLMNATVGRELAPYDAATVVQNTSKIAKKLRDNGGMNIYVRVAIGEILELLTDVSFPRNTGAIPPGAGDIVPDSGIQPEDIVVVKRQWGAFYGTDLEQHLRRRNIKTIIMTGIATNFGVESTARAAQDSGYNLVFVEDAMSSLSGEAHKFVVENIFPRMGRVRSTEAVLNSLP
jgi:nicotinamidase-related amidase